MKSPAALFVLALCLTVVGTAVLTQTPRATAAQQTQKSPTAQSIVQQNTCQGEDKACLFDLLEKTAAGITETSWRDSTYRELAKVLAAEGHTDRALALIPRIQTPDTQAMTIRGIGMAAAENKLDQAAYETLFTQLRAAADKITHAPSHGIALTYIAMAQAFAADDSGAMKTAASMENPALRNKAYAEAAEIQAARGDIAAVTTSIDAIEDAGFRDKAYKTVSQIFADKGYWNQAVTSALKIENSYQESQALLYTLVKQIKPAEVSIQ